MSSAKLPDSIRSLIPKTHKVLAWSEHGGGYVIATDKALISTDVHDSSITPWGNTVAARWNEPMLTVYLQDDLGNQPIAAAWILSEPGLIPHAVHDRVTSANLMDLAREVPGVGSVRFIARRSPEGVTWTTVLESVVNSELSVVQRAGIEHELKILRSTLGI